MPKTLHTNRRLRLCLVLSFWSQPSSTEDIHLAHCIYFSFYRLIWALHDLFRVVRVAQAGMRNVVLSEDASMDIAYPSEDCWQERRASPNTAGEGA